MKIQTLINMIADDLSAQGANSLEETLDYYSQGWKVQYVHMVGQGYDFGTRDINDHDFEAVWGQVEQKIHSMNLK